MPHTDMGRLTQEIGAVEAMGWLVNAKRARFDATLAHEGWGERMDQLVEEFEPLMTGRFMVMLGNESLLGDDRAEYVVHFDEDSDRDVISSRYSLKV